MAAVVLAFLACVGFWHSSRAPLPPDFERGSLVIDRFSLFFYAATLAALGALLLCGAELEEEVRPHVGLYHALLLVSGIGVLFTVSATDLVTLAAAMACTVLPLGLALGLRKSDPAAVRTATRSLVLSGFGLAVFVGGAVLLAGLSGTTQLSLVPAALRPPGAMLALAAALLVLGGLGQLGLWPLLDRSAREVGSAPLAPSLARMLLVFLAAVAALLRLLPGGLGGAPGSWELTVALVCAAPALVAPLLALREPRLGRSVTYLLLAQLAVTVIGVISVSPKATSAVLYATLCLIPLVAGFLGLLGTLAAQGQPDGRSALRGLWSRAPAVTALFTLLLVALAGLPPLAGFFARLLTLDSALQAGYGWLLWLGVLSAVLSAAAVLRWLLVLYDFRAEGLELALPGPVALTGVGLCGLAVVLFGVLLYPLFGLAARGALPPLIGP